jgi:hypothetical protein
VRPVVRRIISSMLKLTLCFFANTSQVSAWCGMESTIVPSMSKIKAFVIGFVMLSNALF